MQFTLLKRQFIFNVHGRRSSTVNFSVGESAEESWFRPSGILPSTEGAGESKAGSGKECRVEGITRQCHLASWEQDSNLGASNSTAHSMRTPVLNH